MVVYFLRFDFVFSCPMGHSNLYGFVDLGSGSGAILRKVQYNEPSWTAPQAKH